jgi:hypothetical protein
MFGLGLRIVLAGTAIAALASPALAQDDFPTPEETAAAFKAICLDHPGDHKAQAKAATSAPWNLKKGKDASAQRTYYDDGTWQVGLSTSDEGFKVCSLTTAASNEMTDAKARTAAIEVLGPRPADIEPEEGGFYWTPTIDGREYLIMFQAKTFENDGDPRTMVSYGLGWN